MPGVEVDAFRARPSGTFHGILQWQQLDLLWERMKTGQWYFYQVGETPPKIPHSGEGLAVHIDALNTLLCHYHDYDYCGIVYVDDVEMPTLVKIYDPNNLGSSCSHGTTRISPRYLLSTARPAPPKNPVPAANHRKRWWRLLSL